MPEMEQTIHYININGKLISTGQSSFTSSKKIIEPDSVFESMRYYKGEIILEKYHWDRLKKGLIKFGYRLGGQINWDELSFEIQKTVQANKLFESARIRLCFNRTNQDIEYVVETWALGMYEFKDAGLEIDLFEDGTKPLDETSNLKKGSQLLYVSAINYAKAHKINDVVILNSEGRVCESTVSNVFWIRNGIPYTVPLSEGPVAGVLRQYLMEKIDVQEKTCTVQDLLEADEVFFTNMIRGIQPVTRFRTSTYQNTIAKSFFGVFIEPLTR